MAGRNRYVPAAFCAARHYGFRLCIIGEPLPVWANRKFRETSTRAGTAHYVYCNVNAEKEVHDTRLPRTP